VTVTWPDSQVAAQAYTGLATLAIVAGDIDTRISSLRNVVRIEPRGPTISFLADALANRGEDGDVSEAADFYRTAYLDSGDPPIWVYAQRAIGLYAASGFPEREAAFRDQVARDSGMDLFAEEVTSEDFADDLGRAETVLEIACDRIIAAIFGAATCEDGIESMVVATRSVADVARRQAIADITTQAMSELSVLGAYTRVTAEEKNERDYRFGSILQEWIESGAATARVYVAWAQNPNSGRSEYLAALERAVELAPQNGRYRYWLALAYRDQGRLSEAIEHLRLARDTIPENVGLSPELIDERIRGLETALGITP
jgi:tetratricopeptide (TPR) repeat protein